jgi:hypothetical protein
MNLLFFLGAIIFLTLILLYLVRLYNMRHLELEKRTLIKRLKRCYDVLTLEKAERLPEPIKKWLIISGMIDKHIISNVKIHQKSILRFSQNSEKWFSAESIQWFDAISPAFLWVVKVKYGFLRICGRDLFIEGKGSMKIKLFSIFGLVNSNGKNIDEGSAQRFLAEMIWFPTSFVNDYISWESIDSTSAKATLKYKETVVDGIFNFDKDGFFESFSTMRFMDSKPGAVKHKWSVSAIKNEKMKGITIPTELEATWHLPEGDWTWLKMKVKEIKYNIY